MITLYQFPISHFCEKARWALDYKGLPFKRENLMPGTHTKITKKLGAKSSVPLLVDGEQVVQGSDHIITYLDERYPDPALSPADSAQRGECLVLEESFAETLGKPLRLINYHHILEQPNTVAKLLGQGGPFYRKFLLRAIMPKMSGKMRELMKINDASAAKAEETMSKALGELRDRLRDRPYLVGNHFSRADLTAGALLAPLIRPDAYGVNWPESQVSPLANLADQFRDVMDWVGMLYREHRPTSA